MIPTLMDIIRGLLDGTITQEEARKWLAEHERLQAEVDGSDVSPSLSEVLLSIISKRAEQDARWGKIGTYKHAPFDYRVMAHADNDTNPVVIAQAHGIISPEIARLRTEDADPITWMDILVEEVSKLTEGHSSKPKLREQLIDVAGVAAAWAEQLDEEIKT